MCKNLVGKGNLDKPLIIFNRTTKRAEDLSSEIGHSIVASSIEEAAAKADMIFICLGDDTAVQENVEKILKGNIKDKLIVDCSTIHPNTTAMIAKTIEAHGGRFVACPVFGAPAMAEGGQLVCVLAGPKEEVEKVIPYCKGVIGRANINFGGQPAEKATLLKVIGNTFILSMVETLSEGLVVAEKTGLGVDALHQFLEMMFPGPYVAYSNRMRSGDYHKREEPLFAVDLAMKDARHAQALANKAGVHMENVEVAQGHLKVVKDHMGARGDIAGIYGAKRIESGMKFEN
jgi:3-hydroxyisobutyrate dehydrogenase-like beta-hydroxyacid dehydrogenase